MSEKAGGGKGKERTVALVPREPERAGALIHIRELADLSGRDALNHILDRAQPRAVVQSLSRVDFYWLVKQVGEDDALPLLRLASVEQWEHLLDMEIWDRDRFVPAQIASWLGKLLQADPPALVAWLFGEGELLCYHYLFHHLQVEVKREDDEFDLPDDFFTLDGIFYVRIQDKEHEETISNLLRQMAAVDYPRYQSLLSSLAGVLPAELEEEIYRRRNMRLAEDGFLPFEEAISLYSHVKMETVAGSCSNYLLDPPLERETGAVPLIPFFHANRHGLLTEASGNIPDPLLLDRLRLEFAGLCNQMISADRVRVTGMEPLVEICRKAAGYLSLGLEGLAGGRADNAEELLRLHPLVLIFQVGFSLTLELKWETERWAKRSWSLRMGFDYGFWGDEWGSTIEGILQKRPLYFPGGKGGPPRHFEKLSEVQRSRAALKQVFVLDKLLEAVHARYPRIEKDAFVNFHKLLFTFWSRKRLELEPGFEPIYIDQVKSLFEALRKGRTKDPHRMEEYRSVFVNDLVRYGDESLDEPEKVFLRDTLSRLWDEFREEYARIALPDLEGRFSRFILVRPGSADLLH